MPESPSPPSASPPPNGVPTAGLPVETDGSVDSVVVRPPAKTPASEPPPAPVLARAKRLLLTVGSVFYGAYLLWLLALLVLLPSPTGGFRELLAIGQISALAGAAALILGGIFALTRIAKADVSIVRRRWSLLKVILVILPGIVLSGVTPFLISREPTLAIDITHPQRQDDMVAPLAVTFSAERSTEILRRLGFKPILYSWDYDGDGKVNEETVLPVGTAIFERQGLYTTSVRIKIEGNEGRVLQRRVVIPQAVFSVSPIRPVVDKPVRFSITHLLKDPHMLKEVQWDFDGDGSTDETTISPDVIHTFYTVERVRVAATFVLQDRTQSKVDRMVEIFEPVPLPFPVTLFSDPKNLLGPAPFGAIFRIETEEPLREVQWSFGDGTEERGPSLRRIGHAFDAPSIYPVTVKVRSSSGKIAELSTLVRVTENLGLPDLRFDGSPAVSGDRIRGEVPVEIDLTAKTSAPLVEFFWEAPNATNAHSTGARIQAIYREEGTYTITLIGKDPQGRVLRKPITIEVLPPAPSPSFTMKPAGGAAPLRVVFDASETFIPQGAEVAGFEWSYGDDVSGRIPELGGARAEHVYDQPGEYAVTLRVVMDDGKEFSTQKTIVVRRPLLDACIDASRVADVHVGDGVRFDATKCGTGIPASVLWDVRNAARPGLIVAQSSEKVYAHVFEETGTFSITLTVRDQLGNEDRETLSITVEP